MPEPVHLKSLATTHTKSCLFTERLRLVQSKGVYLSPLGSPQYPFEGFPGEGRFAPGEILHHKLSSWCQQSLQSQQSHCWLQKVMHRVGESDQIKGPRRVRKMCCFASSDLRSL